MTTTKPIGIKPTKEIWLARDEHGLWAFPVKPTLGKSNWWINQITWELCELPEWMAPEIKEGECRKVSLTFEFS